MEVTCACWKFLEGGVGSLKKDLKPLESALVVDLSWAERALVSV